MNMLRPLAALLAASGLAAGQVALPATVFDGNGGPLLADTVYTRAGNLSVPAGETLTIQPGAILKLSGRVLVDGELLAAGTAEQPIVVTSLADDSAGGDTNGDGGASLPAPGQSGGLDFRNGCSGVVSHAELRYGGGFGFPGLNFSGADTPVAISHVTVRDGSTHGVDFNGHATPATLDQCSFVDNADRAIEQVHIDVLDNLTNNTASGSGLGDIVNVTSTTLTTNLVLGPQNGLNGTVFLASNPTVTAAAQLVLQPGLTLKFVSGRLIVDGDLQVQGTALAPVILTSLQDDSAGGDTNGDGSDTQGAPGQWGGLEFRAGCSGSVAHAEIRYHGAFGFSGLQFSSADTPVAVSHTLVRDGSRHGADFNSHATPATLDQCSFVDNAQRAIEQVNINVLPNLTGNTASGNLLGDMVDVSNTTLVADVSLGPENALNDTLFLAGNPTVTADARLALDAGLVLKFVSGRLIVDGELQVQGTEAQPVIFTALADDTAGGDTTADGDATQPGPGQWGGLEFRAGASGSVAHAEIRYHGGFGFSGLYFGSADTPLAISDVLVRDGSNHGVDFNGVDSSATLTRVHSQDNAGWAMEQANINSLPRHTDNTAAGNGFGDVARVTSVTTTGDAVIGAANTLGSVVYLVGNPTVVDGTSLRVEEGVVFKLFNGTRIIVDGALDMLGTPKHPVVVTSLTDDAFGGDSNADGDASLPGKGQLGGIELRGGSGPSTLRNVLVRWAGGFGFAGVTVDSPDALLHQVRVEHAGNAGFTFRQSAHAEELVAFDCLRGIDLLAGSANLMRCTAAHNVQTGFMAATGFTGFVSGSLSGGNGTDDWLGFANAVVQYSGGQGTPLGTGTVPNAPTFVDGPAGDLRPALGSVGIDAGDPDDAFFLAGMDQGRYPRVLDGDLDGNKRVDMGAYEFTNLELAITGDATPGGSLDVDLSMTAPFEETFMFIGVEMFEYNVGRYGSLFVSLSKPHVIMVWPLPPKMVTLDIPEEIDVPVDFILQAGGRLMRSASAPGNLSNPVCVTVE